MFNSNTWPNSASFARYIRLWNLSDLDFDLLRSLKVKYDSVIRLPLYGFLLLFNNNIWPSCNSAPLRDLSFQNLSDLNIELSKLLRSNVITSIYYAYAFLLRLKLMFNSNIWPNFALLRDIRLRNLRDLGFDLSRALKVKCDGVIWLSIYGFLLIYAVTSVYLSRFSSYSHARYFLLSLTITPKSWTRGPRTLALCLTAAVGMKLANFCRLVSKTHCCKLNQ